MSVSNTNSFDLFEDFSAMSHDAAFEYLSTDRDDVYLVKKGDFKSRYGRSVLMKMGVWEVTDVFSGKRNRECFSGRFSDVCNFDICGYNVFHRERAEDETVIISNPSRVHVLRYDIFYEAKRIRFVCLASSEEAADEIQTMLTMVI